MGPHQPSPLSISAYFLVPLSTTPGQKPPHESSKSRNKAGEESPDETRNVFPDRRDFDQAFVPRDGGRVVVKAGLEPCSDQRGAVGWEMECECRPWVEYIRAFDGARVRMTVIAGEGRA